MRFEEALVELNKNPKKKFKNKETDYTVFLDKDGHLRYHDFSSEGEPNLTSAWFKGDWEEVKEDNWNLKEESTNFRFVVDFKAMMTKLREKLLEDARNGKNFNESIIKRFGL